MKHAMLTALSIPMVLASSLPITATAQTTPISTPKGGSFNVRSEFGLTCDGSTNDTAKFAAMVASVNALGVPATLVFPGVCLIDAGLYAFTNNITWEGTAPAAGIKVATANVDLMQGLLRHTVTHGAITFLNFTLNLNGANSPKNPLAAIYTSPGSGIVFIDSEVLNSGIVGAEPAALFSVAAYGPTFCRIRHSKFTATVVQNTQSRALNLGGHGANAGNDCIIDHNTIVNNGIATTCINHLIADSNTISGWGYGAAIGTNVCGKIELPGLITNNDLHDSGNVPDVTGVTGDKIGAIESWQYGVVVSSNKIRNTCGPGVIIGGRSVVTDNDVKDPGSCLLGDYLQSAYVVQTNNTESGSNSIFARNKASDTTGRTLYGLSDRTTTTGVILGDNDFKGVKGAYNIRGGAYFMSPSPVTH